MIIHEFQVTSFQKTQKAWYLVMTMLKMSGYNEPDRAKDDT